MGTKECASGQGQRRESEKQGRGLDGEESAVVCLIFVCGVSPRFFLCENQPPPTITRSVGIKMS